MSKSKKSKAAPPPPNGTEGRMLLAKELALYGCEMDPVEFNELLADLHHAMHPSWNPEQLLYAPTYGIVYVKAVRARSIGSLPEEMILRRLRNIQKAGKH